MKTRSLSLNIGAGVACLCLMTSAALSAETFTGVVELTAASAGCPAELLASGEPVKVQFVLPEALGHAAGPAMRISMTGEFRDLAVRGCSVGFSAGSVGPLTYVSADGPIAHERGCRGYCGL